MPIKSLVTGLIVVFFSILLGIIFWEFARGKVFASEEQKNIINHNLILEQIEAIGKLELVKFKFKDIMEYRVKKPWYSPDSKAVLIISGESVGCIDLKKIKPEDILETDSIMFVQLPVPELCYTKINHQETRLYEVSTGIFSRDEGKIVEDTYKEAEKQLVRTALSSNILEQTKINAELLLKPIFERIARKKVIFKHDLSKIKIQKETYIQKPKE